MAYFVVHEHWGAVPKGPLTQFGMKKIIIQVYEHPLEDGKFESTISEGKVELSGISVSAIGTGDQISKS